ncbi:HEPN domain-containing protein [Magnetospirillum moscoviense]|uniref:HEPN domain-containing protein n=1 Tax=Magnetospirillum moscoviense TaxID=1437059 RepID=UPI003CCBD774
MKIFAWRKCEPPLIDPAAFHCQQAAEKIIKGLLLSIPPVTAACSSGPCSEILPA